MKAVSLIAGSAFALLTLVGCGNKQESYSTDYLYANDDIRAKVLAECAENKQSDANCKNANEAQAKKGGDDYASKAFK